MSRKDEIRRTVSALNDSAAALRAPATFMEVCGTHTMSAFRSGLHSLMPTSVNLLSGPGCPVCVTAQGDIDLLISLAADRNVTLCTYGDMLRVPGQRGSLERARSGGADVRVVYSALDAVTLAGSDPSREVVFAAVGFETTAPASAAALLRAEERGLRNFSILVSHKRIVPAMRGLLESGDVRVDGFLCPGHVSVILGADAYRPIVERYGVPCVIGGFEPTQMARALAELTAMVRKGSAALVNQYPEAVSPTGNRTASELLAHVFEPATVRWRGLGTLPDSGLVVRPEHRGFDAFHRFGLSTPADREPKACRCGEVIAGRIDPPECKLFNNGCTPIYPIGPCMVSSEGTCQAWFKYARAGVGSHRRRVAETSRDTARPDTGETVSA